MCGARLQGFGFCVGLFGPEARHQDLHIRVQDYEVGDQLRESDDEKAVDVIYGRVGANERQQARVIAVGVCQLGSATRQTQEQEEEHAYHN